MKFSIDLKFFLILTIFLFTNQIEIYTVVMICVFLHELGHLFAGIMLKIKPHSIEIKPLGLSVNFETTPKDINKKIKNGNLFELKKILIAIAGPIVNITIILIATICKIQSDFLSVIIYSNIIIIMFNLLLIYPLDGAKIIRGILHIFLGKRKSINIIRNISIISLIIFIIFASIFTLYFKNIVYILMVVILGGMYLKEEKVFKAKEHIYMAMDKLKKDNENK